MSRVYIVIVLLFTTWLSYGQQVLKQEISIEVLGKWPKTKQPVISSNGNYIAFTISNQPVDNSTLVIQSTKGNWKKSIIPGAREYFFSGDSRKLIYSKGDSLYFLVLGKESIKSLGGVSSFKASRDDVKENGKWLAYQMKSPTTELILLNLLNGGKQKFENILDYKFSRNGKTLLLLVNEKSKGQDKFSLRWLDLQGSIKGSEIWTNVNGLKPDQFVFSADGRRLAFITSEIGGRKIWLYTQGTRQAIVKVEDGQNDIERGLSISDNSLEFSMSNQWLFFRLQTHPDNRKATGTQVDVWSYRDILLQPEQLKKGNEPVNYIAAIDLVGNSVKRLEKENEEVVPISGQSCFGEYVLIMGNKDTPGKWWPYTDSAPYLKMLSLKDGTEKLISKDCSMINFLTISFSPDGEYFLYWDPERSGYFSFDCKSGKEVNVTASIKTPLVNEYPRNVNASIVTIPLGWYKGGRYFLFSDGYDIWKLDAQAKDKPLELTLGYGKKHMIRLRGINEEESNQVKQLIYGGKQTLLIVGFDMTNKYNGFFRCRLDKAAEPELLTMGPYTYYKPISIRPHTYALNPGIPPIKALNANAWIVERSSAAEAPNYFFTRNLSDFKQLSNLEPQKAYNWLTSELIKWALPDGKECHGVLYKPENFDPNKKYPVIFNFYEKLSHRLYEFPYPNFTAANIDIAWFVSQGYLVCTPDIHYTVAGESGKVTGESALESVESAAKYLIQRSYVDRDKMGIDGHSFGGGEANYILTHSRIFAAVAEAAGTSDVMMSYLSLIASDGSLGFLEETSKQTNSEVMQGRMGSGVTPWSRPELYDKASALRTADKATAPLLIMHNYRDNQISFRQGLALYLALRRLEKPVWMLQYDGDGHAVGSTKGMKDYTIRITQFFDHYLKGKPAPRWMTQGIPANVKGIESRFELDPAGNCGKDCKACKEWNSKQNK